MALNDSYVSTGELKSYARIDDAIDDAQITSVGLAISRNIERFCGRQFNDAGSATARVYYPLSTSMAIVDDFSTTTGLIVASDGGAGTYPTTIASTSYTLHPSNGIVDGQTGHPYRKITLYNAASFNLLESPSLQVTARWGWAAVPSDVKQAALIQGARIFGRRESVHGVLGAGDFVVRVSNQLDPDVAEMLSPYRVGTLVA